MTSVLSVSIGRSHPIGCLTRLCKIVRNHNVTQVASMKRLSLKEQRPMPGPLPYWKKVLSTYDFAFHLTSLIYDENTRLLVVEGPPSAGKDKLCAKLADEFGLLYMPAPSHDDVYINPYGYDLRSLDPQLPPLAQSYDLKRFLREPNHRLAATFQLTYLVMRYEQYVNALLHMLATGQGVVLNRSVYSDVIFIEAMYNAGYVKKEVVDYFNVLKRNCLHVLLRPHAIIYLDIPPDVTLENIRKSGNQDEINSKVFTKSYLTDLDKITREKCLFWLSSHSEILIYESGDESIHTDIVEDVEKLYLEEEDHKDKFQDWVFLDLHAVQERIIMYQDKEYMLYKMLRNTGMVLPEDLGLPPDEAVAADKVFSRVPSEKYAHGYNPYMGDDLWKAKYGFAPYLSLYRRTSRDYINCKMFQV